MVEEVKILVSNILDTQLPKNCDFHSKHHTFDVLKNVELIGKYSKFKEDDLNILRLCALFHDVGYVKVYSGHVQESAIFATNYLQAKQIKDSTIRIIVSAILATKVPQQPNDIFSEILCDADLMHLTYDNYFEQIDLMRQEWKLSGIASFTEKEFHINSIQFFNSHKYHSGYGKLVLQQKKQTNLERVIRKIEEL
ncbi:MAG: HD domain-containing protein [Bacteroidetes bacterium]|nr:HD domain-containing protein [Bacteroidota bacterium]